MYDAPTMIAVAPTAVRRMHAPRGTAPRVKFSSDQPLAPDDAAFCALYFQVTEMIGELDCWLDAVGTPKGQPGTAAPSHG